MALTLPRIGGRTLETAVTQPQNARSGNKKETLNQRMLDNVRKHWALYILALPGVLWFLVFRYVPVFGSLIAFQDYQIFNGFWKSPWVGFKHFEFIFSYPEFLSILRNTLLIALYQLVFGFPAPLVLALLLNEAKQKFFKRTVQTFFYLPHFLSWVIIGGIMFEVLSTHGVMNKLVTLFGGDPILFMQKEQYYRTIVTVSSIWKEVGWNAIIYLAALTGINPNLYEAATVDGAGKWRQLFSITLPSLAPTIMILFLIKIGNFMELGFEQSYVLLTPMTFSVGDILDTYVFRSGVQEGNYSVTTAIGLFKSLVGFILLWGANLLSKRTTGQGLF
ncbi:ABC transporter permease subunit [Paenibacillus sp. LMG 31456]|uniref:ABC transporter permease subunit n=2 Tax=Paenibacillus foliorum TaxID=2654974 RepID=A0A972GPZ6_9BACL|nr:ABC transporter permease subunit [Paenibacillus foliorum]